MIARLLVRDAAIAFACAICWWVDAQHRYDAGFAAVLVGVVTGLTTGLIGYLIHEWGHLLGSLLSGSVVHYPQPGESPLSFHFDSAVNSRAQFYWMTFGGYLASLLSVIGIWQWCPHDAWSGRVAIALALLGTATIFLAEVPITLRVLRGAPLPTGFAYRRPEPR
jgi:hypothetical protein